MSSFMLYQLTSKNSRQKPYLPGGLLQALLLTAAYSSSSVVGVTRKFLHPVDKVLWTAFSIWVTRTSHTWISSYLICRNATKDCRMPLVVNYVTTSLSIMQVIICETCRFHICRRYKRDGYSPWNRVASWVSMVVDWTHYQYSLKTLNLR